MHVPGSHLRNIKSSINNTSRLYRLPDKPVHEQNNGQQMTLVTVWYPLGPNKSLPVTQAHGFTSALCENKPQTQRLQAKLGVIDNNYPRQKNKAVCEKKPRTQGRHSQRCCVTDALCPAWRPKVNRWNLKPCTRFRMTGMFKPLAGRGRIHFKPLAGRGRVHLKHAV